MMDRTQAIADIGAVFGAYKSLMPSDTQLLQALKGGKLYELYVLSEVIDELAGRGFRISFIGSTLQFKAGPGQIKLSDPHYHVRTPQGRDLWAFVDIEFRTLGSSRVPVSDNSGLHELNIVVVRATPPYPDHTDILFAVECKSGKFGKKIIKESLGVRRELSYFDLPQPSMLTHFGGSATEVRANPASEFWLAHLDPVGSHYDESPLAFGIELKHFEP
jgi:hypothetical protein